jgi:uncharacterized protein YeaO (DUF488 family)
MPPTISLKRAYAPPASDDGFRILIDRLWPRGLSKEKAAVDLWLKDIAPSTELRKWFNHEAEKWPEFRKRYKTEIRANKAAADLLEQALKDHQRITFVYAAKDEAHNDAIVLQEVFGT